MTKRELVLKAKSGHRITKADAEYSMFDAPLAECPKPRHLWRVIVCDSGDDDVSECRHCGKQIVHGCDFDEEFS